MAFPGRWSIVLVLVLAVHVAVAKFTVEEYEKWRQFDGRPVRVVAFPGHHAFSRNDLFAIIATEKPAWFRRYLPFGHRGTFYADQFAADILRMEHFYSREGFPDVTVRGQVFPGKKDMTIKFEIVEGRPVILTAWNTVFLSDTGAAYDSARWSKLMPIKIGKRLAQSDVAISADTIRYKLNTLGHARAAVEYDIQRDTINYTAQVRFGLRPGHFDYFGNTTVTGLKQIEEETVRRELTYHILDAYDIRELEKTRKKVVRLESFTLVSVRADTSVQGDVLPVNVRTEEGNRYRIRSGVGYHSEERARGQVEFKDLNFFGRGRRLTWEVTAAELHRLTEIRLFWPHTPANWVDLTLAPRWEWESQPAFRRETRAGRTTFSAMPGQYVTVALSNDAGIEITDPKAPDSLTTRYVRSIESISIAWDTRDHPLVPRRGHFLGTTLSESGAFYGLRYRWWRSSSQARVLVPLGRLYTAAGRTDFGFMGPLHQTPHTPIPERFYYGGTSTVRGWATRTLSPRSHDETRTPIGGDVAFGASAEVRRQVWGPASVAVFMDIGNVWSRPYRVKILNLYPSAGAGLLVLSPVGPIRVDFGYQLLPNPYDPVDHKWHSERWEIHLSLGNPF